MPCATISGHRIKEFLPGRDGHVGGTAADNRLFVDAVIFRNRTGVSWHDLPERFGNGVAVQWRFRRWCEIGVFTRVFATLSIDADAECEPACNFEPTLVGADDLQWVRRAEVWSGMITVDTVGKVRRAYFVQGRKIKAIARELKLARNTVRDIVRAGSGGAEATARK